MNCEKCGKPVDETKKHVVQRARDRVTRTGVLHFKCWRRYPTEEDDEE